MVSFVIINYNTLQLTSDCIESIIEKTRGVTYEVIVVDNASSEQGVESLVGKFSGRISITLCKRASNLGFAKGNNFGIQVATGNFILLLNSDTVLKNDVASILVNFVDRNKRVAAVTSRLFFPDGTVQHNCQRFPSIRYTLAELLRIQKLLPKRFRGQLLFGGFFDYDTQAFPDWVWGTCFLFKKELLSQLPGKKLADDIFMYGEDIQWCLEFRKLGYEIGFEPAAEIVHLMGKSGGQKSELMKNGRDFLMKKYYSAVHRTCISVLEKCLAWSQR